MDFPEAILDAGRRITGRCSTGAAGRSSRPDSRKRVYISAWRTWRSGGPARSPAARRSGSWRPKQAGGDVGCGSGHVSATAYSCCRAAAVAWRDHRVIGDEQHLACAVRSEPVDERRRIVLGRPGRGFDVDVDMLAGPGDGICSLGPRRHAGLSDYVPSGLKGRIHPPSAPAGMRVCSDAIARLRNMKMAELANDRHNVQAAGSARMSSIPRC